MELFSYKPGDDGLPGHERGLAMIAVMATTTMAVFDGAIVNIALPRIAQALEVSVGAAVWVSNGYLLSVAMTLAIFAALATRTGFRALYASGLAVFTLASLGCALSTSLDMLVAMRVLQGLGGAAVMSIGPAILRSIFPGRLLGRILGLNAVLIAISTAIAPLLGGTLLSALSWQWLFAINIPLGLVALVLTLRVIPAHRSARQAPFDVAGGLLSAMTLGALVMAASALSHPAAGGAVAFKAGGYGLIALLAGIAFVLRQQRAPKPLLPLALFSSTRFSLAALTSMASFISQGITFIALPFLFQNVYGYSALGAALLFTPWPVGIVLAASHAGRLADRYPPALISTVGLCVLAVGLTLLAMLPAEASVWDIWLRSFVCGVGFGCFQSPNNREMLSNASRENSSYASGMLAIMRTFGQCLGTACVGGILSAHARSSGVMSEMQTVHVSLWIAVFAVVAAIVISASRIRRA